ncbi:MAG: sigma 54-interacting transcriptional regulator, partial [Acidobacteria bacterium]|nr:sigma 54-interacting transcriptional regulator [Acidobacteriota bacterium]
RPLFDAISGSLRQALDVQFASLTLWDSGSNQLRRHVLDIEGPDRLLQEDPRVPLEGTPSGQAFLTRRPVVMNGQELETALYPVIRYLTGHGFRSGCAVPLICGERVLGTMNIATHRESISQDEVTLLEQVAGQVAIALDNAAAYNRIEELNARLAEEKLYLKDEIRTNYFFEEIVGRSAALNAVLRQVETVAHLSSRARNTFAKVNCAAIPTGLLESELFGHEKGAFTGAIAQSIGRFEMAHRGTVFLDEVGDIPLELQPKLLRVLQEREFERLGSSRTVRVDVRLVAATNRDLMQMMEDREFRADLYYRLNVFPVVVPPLRERPEDIPLLVSYFTQQYAARMGKQVTSIPSEAMEHLVRYPWPGNIRELQNLIERAVIISPGPVLKIHLEVLRTNVRQPSHPAGSLEEAERQHIVHILEESNWVLAGPNGAAAKLGLKRSTLQFRMKKLGINRPR